MGKPLTIQPEDDQQIENLKERLGAHTKIEVVRVGLQLLEKETSRRERIVQWRRAAALVSKQSAEVNRAFQPYSRLRRI